MRAGSAELSRNQKELQFLQQRQKEFKMAALQAKKSGDMETAKYNLRQAKVGWLLSFVFGLFRIQEINQMVLLFRR